MAESGLEAICAQRRREASEEPAEIQRPYGDVPAIAFSEAMGDLVKISGKSEALQSEGEDA